MPFVVLDAWCCPGWSSHSSRSSSWAVPQSSSSHYSAPTYSYRYLTYSYRYLNYSYRHLT